MSSLNQTASLPPGAAGFGAYVIEVGGAPAGVLVRAGADFRFFAARREFGLLEGSAFRTPHAAQRAAERMGRAADERRTPSLDRLSSR